MHRSKIKKELHLLHVPVGPFSKGLMIDSIYGAFYVQRQVYSYPHSTEEETEGQRGNVPRARSYSFHGSNVCLPDSEHKFSASTIESLPIGRGSSSREAVDIISSKYKVSVFTVAGPVPLSETQSTFTLSLEKL